MSKEYCDLFPNSARCKRERIQQELLLNYNNYEPVVDNTITNQFIEISGNAPVSAPTPRRDITDTDMANRFYGPIQPTPRRNITDRPHEEIAIKKYQNKRRLKIFDNISSIYTKNLLYNSLANLKSIEQPGKHR